MNKPAAFLILTVVFVLGLSLGSGVAYVVFGPGISASMPFTGSSAPSAEAINEYYTRDYTDASGKKLLKMSLRNLGWATQQSLNMPPTPPDFTDSLTGLTFDGTFQLNIPRQENDDVEVSADLETDHYFEGVSRNKITVEKPQLDDFGAVTFKERGNEILAMFPSSNEYYKTTRNALGGYDNNITNFLDSSDVSKSSRRFNGQTVHALTVASDDGEATFLVSRTPPHTILQIETKREGRTSTVEYADPNRRQQFQVKYQTVV